MRTPEAFPIFIGYDSREAIAYHVCAQSILERASMPVALYPLALNTVRGLYRETHGDGSNEFIYSRFLVPWLCGFGSLHTHALFLDGDMVVRGDVAELWALRRSDVGVQVVRRDDYETKHPTKYLGAKNENYPRKNWSSVILWNCGFAPHKKLTPDFIMAAEGSFLHRFRWLEDDRIGSLPPAYNVLVGEENAAAVEAAKLLHYTIGTPCFRGHEAQPAASEWYENLRGALNVEGQKPAHLFETLRELE